MFKLFEMLGKAKSLALQLVALVKELALEFGKNGRLTLAYIINELPGLSPYPGLADAIKAYLEAPSKSALTLLITHIVLAVFSGLNVSKMVLEATEKVSLKKAGLTKRTTLVPAGK